MKTKRIKKELESDDELPPSYGEDFVLPAYENEHRFDPIVFRWINDTQKRANTLKEKDQGHVKSDSVHSTNMQKYKIKGYLSQQDLYCLKSVIGLVDFYIEFGEELYRLSSIPICIIGQAGHEAIADSTSNTLENQPHLYNLEGQIEHKFDLISTYIDKKSKLHLIGHSIGAWQHLMKWIQSKPSNEYQMVQQDSCLIKRPTTVLESAQLMNNVIMTAFSLWNIRE
ncbi:unnamed protein product [Leptosia nina]|uniref:Lipid droplet-associated hydrolase n=1 Tax=Leptosia nina TaxID=320188 RepID=A0AAV1IVV0_9NEOP